MEWLPVISAVLSLVGILLKMWVDGAPQRAQEAQDEDTQRERADIAAANHGDAAAVTCINERIDRLSAPDPDTSDPVGQHGAGDLLGELRNLTGASILPGAGSPSPPPRKS